MKSGFMRRIVDWGRLLQLSARMIAGRRYWLVPLFPLVWIGLQLLFLVAQFRQTAFAPADAQTVLIGLPLSVLGIGLGVSIIAGEIDRRTLEITYTVPGGRREGYFTIWRDCPSSVYGYKRTSRGPKSTSAYMRRLLSRWS